MSYSAVILAESALQSYWRLDELSGNALDSKAAISGTLVGFTVQGAAGLLLQDADRAYSFPAGGKTGGVNFGDNYSFAGTGAYSVEAWVNATVIDSNEEFVVMKGTSGVGGWQLTLNPNVANGSDGIRFYRVDGSGNDYAHSTTNFPSIPITGVTYHLVGIWDGVSLISLYVNGLLAGTSSSSRTIPANSGNLTVGEASAGGNFFGGVIDEVAIYNAALTRQQVQNHYAAGAQTIPAALLSSPIRV